MAKVNMNFYPVLKQFYHEEGEDKELRIPVDEMRRSVNDALVSLLQSCSNYVLVKREGKIIKVVF